MVRNTAREIAIHLSYELSFTDKDIDALLDERLSAETFETLSTDGNPCQNRQMGTGELARASKASCFK